MERYKRMNEQGIYYFHQGTNYRAYDLLGAHFTSNGVVFRVFAPNAKAVSVVGEFNGWNKRANPMYKISDEGIWEVVIENVKEYACYQYVIKTKRGKYIYKSDPYAFHSELRPSKGSKVYNIDNCYKFTDDAWMNSRRFNQALDKPINIYELHLGSWRRYENGEVFDYRKLGFEVSNYAKEMGYTHIEVMPVSEYPYDPSWGYQVTGYYSITSRYGTPADFMDFVNTCHLNGIGVIVDWVPGHFTKDDHGLIEFDGGYVYEDPNPKRMEHEGWGTRIFDYGRCEIQSFLVSSACFLFDKFHIDGIRVDAVSGMLYLDFCKDPKTAPKNNLGGNINLEAKAFIEKTNKVVHELFPGVLTIAEESTAYPYITKKVEDGGLGFDLKWNMGWMNDTLRYMKQDPIYRRYDHDKISFQMTYIYSERYVLALSHDEVVHMKGSMINKMPGEYPQKFSNLKAYYTYMMTHPGKKLLFMGGEIAQFREWSESRELDWSVLKYDTHKKLQDYVKRLNHLYLENNCLHANDFNWDGFKWISVDDKDHNIFAYERIGKNNDKIITILNFSACPWDNYCFSLENGEYELLLDSEDLAYGGLTYRTGKRFNVTDEAIFLDLMPCGALLLKKIK